jgi:RNA polymerase sigma-B factor
MTLSTLDRSRPRHTEKRAATEAEQRAQRATGTADLLARAAGRTGARRARLVAEVVELNMGVAQAIASRYRRRGVPDDDLQQVAYLALTKAARRFDPDAGHDFLSFAVPTIRGELRRYFRDSGWMVRPPRKVQELQGRLFAAQAEMSMVLGRSPSPREVAAHLDEPLEDVEEALAADGCFTPTSLDRPVAGDAGVTIGELLGATDQTRSAVEARVVLAPVVRGLSERDRLVLRMRFFDDRTQQEIAQEIGVTQTQVSRLLSRIFAELRQRIEGVPA